MDVSLAAAPARSNAPVAAEERAPLRGRRLLAARCAWGLLSALALGLFIAAVPALYLRRSVPPASAQAGLAQLGLPESFYPTYWTALHVVFGLIYFAVAATIAWRRSDEGVALLTSAALALLGGANAPTTDALVWRYPATTGPVKLLFFLTCATLILFFFLFPDGRFVPRWLRHPVFALQAGLAIAMLTSGPSPGAEPSPWVLLFLFGGFAAGGLAQHYRYRRVATRAQRQQTKWVVAGLSVGIAGQLLGMAPVMLLPSPNPPAVAALLADLTAVTTIVLGFLCLPLALSFAILRYRLWEIDLVINRMLVYGALTAAVLGLYALIVGGVGALLRVSGSAAVALPATIAIAVLFAPLRARLQRGVNRLMYGDRDDPYGVLSRLGQRLEATLAADAVLPAIVQTVREALKLPYAAIALRQGEAVTLTAAGTPPAEVVRLPLVYQHEAVGELLLAPRAPGEAFGRADRKLLDDLARQAGIAAHAVRLNADLQRARERLVTAREEERRRLRRDLHDGLGPALAALTLQAEAARDLIDSDPPQAGALLADLVEQLQVATDDIRRLVYALRPPALDDLGLIGALRAHAARYDRAGVAVTFDTPEQLPPLPAAVEAAAYRIVQEALTNVGRHAAARSCTVTIALAGDGERRGLRVAVADDGRGLPAGVLAGVGLTSMRERAEELGGSCAIAAAPAGGTLVRAFLPLPDEAREAGG